MHNDVRGTSLSIARTGDARDQSWEGVLRLWCVRKTPQALHLTAHKPLIHPHGAVLGGIAQIGEERFAYFRPWVPLDLAVCIVERYKRGALYDQVGVLYADRSFNARDHKDVRYRDVVFCLIGDLCHIGEFADPLHGKSGFLAHFTFQCIGNAFVRFDHTTG